MLSRGKPHFETYACFFQCFSSLYYAEKLPFFLIKKSLKAANALLCFEEQRTCVREFFLTWTSLQTVFKSMTSELCWHNKDNGAPGRREQSEWQKQEERKPELLSLTLLGKPVCCEIVDWVWLSLWTGKNPSDLTLIKFKIYSQQSGNFCSIFPLGNCWTIP